MLSLEDFGDALTLETSFRVTLSVSKLHLYPQGSGGSNGQRWRDVIYLHDKRLYSCARIAALEQQPVRTRRVRNLRQQ